MGKPSDSEPASLASRQRLPAFFAYVGYLVCVLIAAIVVLEVGGRIGLAVWFHFHKPTIADIVPGNPAYAAFPWAEQCMKEQTARVKHRHIYFPFRIWGITESHGSCVNDDVTDLGVVRRTIDPSNEACTNHSKVKLWVFGGSTVYGTLIPDWATLPSSLSRLLNTSARCVEVRNLGVESYNTNQELILLEQQLKAGHVPDVVIFYDGFNDINAAFSPGGTTGHLGYVTTKWRLEGGLVNQVDWMGQHSAAWRFVQEMTKASGQKKPDPDVPSPSPERVAMILDNYQQNMRIARKLAELYGFRLCAFWQPVMLYGQKPLVAYEKDLLNHNWGASLPREPFVPVYREAELRAQSSREFTFLGHIFDAAPQPLYLDWVHLNPAGNELAAQAIAQHIGDCLRQ
jgi:lysophospholipase L1-like esterase